MRSPFSRWLVLALGVIVFAGCQQPAAPPASPAALSQRRPPPVWRGLHVLVDRDERILALQAQLPRLAAAGVNTLVVEVGYNFRFTSHPELAAPLGTTPAHARDFARAARALGVRVIPELDCLGHQSWAEKTFALLTHHPEFDETPGQFPGNAGIYCRSWCPQHPAVNQVVFALIDELIDAFEADAFHVGLDEVFLLASDHCPRCRGGDPAALFARAVNDLHRHLVGGRHVEMLMWGDRLLDAACLHGGKWENADNGTAPAIDLIPRDIVICDWHYEKQPAYPSVPLLLKKGFRVWPCSWQPLEAAQAFSASCGAQRAHERLLGFMVTVWGRAKIEDLADWPPLTTVLADWR